MSDLNERKENGILPTNNTADDSGIMPVIPKSSGIKPPDKPSDPVPKPDPKPTSLSLRYKVLFGLMDAAPIVAVLSALLAITFCVLVFVPTPYVTAHYETFCRLNIAMPIVAIVFSLISALCAAWFEKYKQYNGKIKFYHFKKWNTRNQVMFIGSVIVIVLSVASLLCGSIYGYLQLDKMTVDSPTVSDEPIVVPPEEKKVTIMAGMTYDEVVAELSGVKNFTLREIDKNGECTDAALFTENGATYMDLYTAFIEDSKCYIIMLAEVEGEPVACIDYTGYDYDFDCVETSEINVTADSIFKQMPSTDGFRTEDGKVIFYNDEDGDYAELCNFNSTELYIPEEYKDYASTPLVSSPVIAEPLADDDTKCSVHVYAFLKSIDIPSEIDGRTVVQIESTSSWSTLKKVTIPKTVTSIGARAFANCTALEEIHFDGTEEEWAAVEKGEDWDKDAGEYILTFVVVEKTLSYALNSAGTAYIVNGIVNCDETDLVIPETYNDLPVVGISKSAFSGCSHLTSVTIPASVTSIGRGAFSGCSGLTSMTIPFVGASKEADSNRYPFGYVFGESSYDGGTATKQTYEAGGSTTSSTYYVPSGLTSVTVLGGEVPYGAFYNCSALTEIKLNAEVSAIGNFALSGCSGLTSVTVPFIGASKTAGSADYPFGYAFGTTAYNGGIATTQTYSVKSSATTSTTTSTTYYIPAGLTSVTVLDGGVPEGAFWGCGELTEVVLPEDCKTIGVRAFYNCAKLAEITIPATVEYLNHDAFNGCSALESVNIPNKITAITGGLFSDCINLKTVTIPSSVKSIGEKAFENCASLANVTIPNGVTTIAQEAFAGCASFTTISISDNVTSIGEGAFGGCSAVESITVSGGNEYYHSSGDCLIENKNGTLLVGCNNSVIPADGSVKIIARDAFKDCGDITNVVIPNSVKTIGSNAFKNCCNIENIEIGKNVEIISDGAFNGCSRLKSLTIPFVGRSIITSEDNYQYPFGYIFGTSCYDGGIATQQSFYGDFAMPTVQTTYYIPSSLKTVVVIGGEILRGAFDNCNNITDITIPETITAIGTSAFFGCSSLTNITIPSTVTEIGSYAFECCNHLVEVYNKSSLNITAGSE